MATRARGNDDSAILIINDPHSAERILHLILQYTRLFAQHPIRILRGDKPCDRELILAFIKKYQIREAPSLITRDGLVITGCARISDFIPRLAHAINNVSRQQRTTSVPIGEDAFREHQLHASDEMDEMGADEEDELDKTEIGARINKYKEEMKKRGAHVLGDGVPPNAPRTKGKTPAGAKSPKAIPDNDDDVEDDDRAAMGASDPGRAPVRRARVAMAPPVMPPPISSRASQGAAGTDKFDQYFNAMNEETPT